MSTKAENGRSSRKILSIFFSSVSFLFLLCKSAYSVEGVFVRPLFFYPFLEQISYPDRFGENQRATVSSHFSSPVSKNASGSPFPFFHNLTNFPRLLGLAMQPEAKFPIYQIHAPHII